ncbi:GroES-like zinc-binding alcohol dehydrogenase family protein [Gossypium australe]|uniref:GroES-like zinc-binding alcohol dehydrogenase family protein n=1 Tax=Gossypium australe TaxID=47621 RepID=A0A5B6VW51_9ROSI|nr:GroES-like zinc-binding alcohol dehydrogenase family protein [Gossypium australe]
MRVKKSVINGTPSIEFSDRIFQILIRDMENIVVLKLLRHNIGFSVLQNKIYSLRKPLSPF